MKTVFGFGSLMSLDSLQASAPEVISISSVYIKGYKRDFSVWDPLGFTKTYPELKGIGFCALDTKVSSNSDDIVNGIIFRVSDDTFEELKIREQEYQIVSTKFFDFISNVEVGECIFFSANKNNGEYNFGCKAQEKYLQVCLDGAKELGEDFYSQFIETTFIGNNNLKTYV